MIDVSQVSAVVVTRGDVDLSEILNSIPFDNTIVWDNSREKDLAVYGRYAALDRVDNDIVFVQDDDCVLAPEAFEQLLAGYKPGHVTANMPQRFRDHYPDSCLVGFGAIFGRDLPIMALGKFVLRLGVEKALAALAEEPGFFYRTCDVVFTTLTPRVLVDLPYRNLPWCNDASRMWKQASHYGERQRMLELARQVRDA